MSVVRFTIPGNPVAWKRQRTNGKRRFPAPGQTEARAAIVRAYRDAAKGVTFSEVKPAVDLHVHAVFALPQRPGSRRMGDPHIQKPDADNIGKLVKDALNGVAYDDDCQVSTITVVKQWSDRARTTVTLEHHSATRGRAA